MNFKFLNFFGMIFIILLPIFLVYYSIKIYENKYDFVLNVEYGDSINLIADSLKENNIISSSYMFRFYHKYHTLKYKDDSLTLKACNYHFSKGLNMITVYSQLQLCESYENKDNLKITIPEGWTINKIAVRLNNNEIISTEEFILETKNKVLLDKYNIPFDSFEGYLFPDTYFFQKNSKADLIIKIMVDNFFKHIKNIAPNYQLDKEFFNTIIMASIVQSEYIKKEEAANIASVFYNRLNSDYKLESCATLVYALTEIYNKPRPQRIFYSDLELDSSYNTYRYKGLTPSPISNAGDIALNAAFNPNETEYWFFVLKPSLDEHKFSKTLQEHNEATEFYVKQVF